MKGSKPGLTTAVVINLAHCRECTVLQESSDDLLEPLYPIDITKVRRKFGDEKYVCVLFSSFMICFVS